MTKVKKHKNDKVTTVSTIGLLKASLKFMSANEKKSLIYGLVLSFFEALLYTFGTAMTGFIISWFFTKDIIANKATFNAPMFIVAMIGLALSFGLYLVTLEWFKINYYYLQVLELLLKCGKWHSKKLLYMPISYHDKNKVGDQISTLTNDINNIALTMTQLFNETSGKIFKVIFSVIFMLCYSLTLSAIVLPVTFLFCALSWLLLSKARAPYIKMTDYFGDMNAYVEEMLKNTKVTQSFDREEESFNKFEIIARNVKKQSFIGDVYSKFFDPWFVVFSNFLVLIILAISLLFKINNINFVGVVGQDVTALIIGYINLIFTFTKHCSNLF
nr:ABC transporter transmembrane domain-containing protein [Mycoplasmopsis bovis]